jgi:type I restriction enzyme, S subunit
MAGSLLIDNADIVMGQSPPGDTCNTINQGLPLLNGPTEFGAYHPTPIQFTIDARKKAQRGDVLFCVRGSTTGRMNWADREYAIGRGVAAIRHKKNLELQPYVRAVIEYGLPGLLKQATGSTFPNVSAEQLAGLWWPPIEKNAQLAIAHILGTLDDKIELNRRMNETMEAMARALFKSWFVDFDPVRAKADGRHTGLPKHIADLFPDSFEDSEIGEIPKEWKVKPFANTVEIVGGGTPKTSVADYWDGDIPWFSIVDAPGGSDVWVIDTGKKITQNGIEYSSTQILPVSTTIISARGTVGRIALVGVPMAINQSCYGLRGKVGSSGIFTYYSTNELVGRLQQHAHGSVFDTITRDTFAGVPTVLPPTKLVDAFEKLVGPALSRIRTGLFCSRTLATLRDIILPKLISGVIKVPSGGKLE